MNILSVSKLYKEFNGEALFANVSFEINKGDKIAIIGKNGTGKSTLLKMILGDIYIDSGEVFINSKAQIGYLSQSVISSVENTLLDEINEVFQKVLRLEQQIKDLSIIMADDHSDEILKKYERLEHEFSINDGYDFHYKINLILSKFGFTKKEYSRKINTFSGGEKTRIAFAKLLLKNPDLLILDEPTNHLDIEIIEWLEDYLNKYSGAILIVTHDKYFINRVCKRIIELDQKKAHHYYGTFEDYEIEKIKRYELLLRSYTKQQKEIAHLQSFVDRFRYKESKAKSAQDRIKKIDKIVKIDRPTYSKAHVHMSFDKRRTTSDIILDAKNLAIGYENIIAENISFDMRGYDKLAIIGPNGVGKTTLLKVIENKLKALKGKVDFLREYKIGYFDQNQETLHQNKTIFEEIHDYYPMFTNTQVRNKAAQFLFTNDDVHKSISVLSGGEKVRLVLLLLMLEEPELLILDEPTNHLDIETKSIIEDVFNEFTGPIIFVSHDRYFINKIGSKILHMDKDKSEIYQGTYDDYKAIIKSRVPAKKLRKNVKGKKINLDKNLNELEKKIHKLEEKIKELEIEIFKEEVYLDFKKAKKYNDEIAKSKSQLDEIYSEYFNLQEENMTKEFEGEKHG